MTASLLAGCLSVFPGQVMCPACCFKWHASRRQKASGVLGSYTDNLFIAVIIK